MKRTSILLALGALPAMGCSLDFFGGNGGSGGTHGGPVDPFAWAVSIAPVKPAPFKHTQAAFTGPQTDPDNPAVTLAPSGDGFLAAFTAPGETVTVTAGDKTFSIPGAAQDRVILARFDAAGALQGSTSFALTPVLDPALEVAALATAGDGDALVLGSWQGGTLNIGGQTFSVPLDRTPYTFLAKCDVSAWTCAAAILGVNGQKNPMILGRSLAVSGSDVLVGGSYRGTMSYQGAAAPMQWPTSDPADNSLDAFVLRVGQSALDAKAIWAGGGRGPFRDDGVMRLVVGSDAILGAGYYNSDAAMEPFLPASNKGDSWVVRLDLDFSSATSWAFPKSSACTSSAKAGACEQDQALALAALPDGFVVLGRMDTPQDLGCLTGADTKGATDLYVARLDAALQGCAAGTWLRSSQVDFGAALLVDTASSTVFAGGAVGDTLGGAAVQSAGGDDAFVVALDSGSLALRGALQLGGGGRDALTALLPLKGGLLAAGTYTAAFSKLVAPSDTGAFIGQLVPVEQWSAPVD